VAGPVYQLVSDALKLVDLTINAETVIEDSFALCLSL
jgi:hypothetical protein